MPDATETLGNKNQIHHELAASPPLVYQGPVYKESRLIFWDRYPPAPSARPDLAARTQLHRPVGLGPPPRSGRAAHHNLTSRSASLNDVAAYTDASVVTPTPANRYYSHRPPPPIPVEPSQMTVVINLLHQILDDNVEIKSRLTALEAKNTGSGAGRGAAAMRGGRVTQAKRSRRAGGRAVAVAQDDESDTNTIDPALDDNRVSTSATEPSDTDAGDSDALESVAVDIDHLDLSESELRALQVFSTKNFRAVCNVRASEEWPDDPSTVRRNEVTGETYPSPYFQFDVTHPKNQSVCLQVAKQAMQELQDEEFWPSGLKREPHEPRPTWDLALMQELATESFRNLKPSWRAQTNPALRPRPRQAIRQIAEGSDVKWDFLKAFAAARKLAPSFLRDLSHEQYLSDEFSGPEDETESRDAWTVRCAVGAKMPTDPKSLEKLKFLEVISPVWRSPAYSALIHDFEEFAFARGSHNQRYIRVSLGRSSERLPNYAPYNFGILDGWLAARAGQRENHHMLHDWGKFPEPEGCGVELYTSRAEDE
ncbi:hypothetical protein K438DRAFT_2076706 [Mycena galopus ATCC 62051]|nr:hypothetical protein K438DRAFT_2076706 [Mycena galopus ATCC 62051]